MEQPESNSGKLCLLTILLLLPNPPPDSGTLLPTTPFLPTRVPTDIFFLQAIVFSRFDNRFLIGR